MEDVMEFATQILDECIVAANENKKEEDAVNDSNASSMQRSVTSGWQQGLPKDTA